MMCVAMGEQWLEMGIDLIENQSKELNESHSNECVGSCRLVLFCCVGVELGQTKQSKVNEKGYFKDGYNITLIHRRSNGCE